MPRLIVLNGAPGSGKSTLARRYVDDNPLALDLDIDVIRRLLGDWKSDPHAAGLLARAIALAAARIHLVGGHDVIVPQYLGRPDYLVQLTGLAAETGAELHEFILMDTKDVMIARFRARTVAAAHPSHVDAQEMLDRVGGVAQLEAMYDRLLLVIAARPGAQLLPAREGEIEATYAELVRRIG
ncbi:MAG TPA: AAA family ATPase [Jatrophihabitans sp.]|uniref:AAA family ATPase n=1 Tax=Jatrophihabitans sp. TaxID=1932789 RepID=UPI002E08F986|nr:AAA family ATPase [Jatrophihabitans sp.]